MSDDNTGTASTDTTDTGTEAPPAGTSTETPPPADDAKGTEAPPADDKSGDEDIPADVLRKELTKVRGEAANYRTKLREAEAALKDAKTPEEFETARKEMSEQIAKLERQVLVTDVAQDFKLPKELAEVLKGDTKEELEAHAKQLAKFAPPTAPGTKKLSGGLDPNSDEGDDDDPVAAAKAARLRRR